MELNGWSLDSMGLMISVVYLGGDVHSLCKQACAIILIYTKHTKEKRLSVDRDLYSDAYNIFAHNIIMVKRRSKDEGKVKPLSTACNAKKSN